MLRETAHMGSEADGGCFESSERCRSMDMDNMLGSKQGSRDILCWAAYHTQAAQHVMRSACRHAAPLQLMLSCHWQCCSTCTWQTRSTVQPPAMTSTESAAEA